MTRNQKIALGCGGAGCLGLIVVVAAGAVFYFYQRRPTVYANRNSNFNINRDRTVNRSSDTAPSDETPPSGSTSSSSMSEDDRHRLFHAAGATNDPGLMQRALMKLRLLDAEGAPSEDYAEFIGAHIGWLIKNSDFAQTVNTPEKARAYVDAHIDD